MICWLLPETLDDALEITTDPSKLTASVQLNFSEIEVMKHKYAIILRWKESNTLQACIKSSFARVNDGKFVWKVEFYVIRKSNVLMIILQLHNRIELNLRNV